MEVDKPIAIVITLFIILVSVFYLILPKYNAFQDILTKVGEKEMEYQSKNAYYIEVTRVYKELMLYESSLEKMETALPEKFSLSPLVNLIYREAVVENGIVIQRINTGKFVTTTLGSANATEANITLNIIGSYSALEKFISSLEKSARLIEGEGISFSVEMPTTERPTVSQIYPITLEIKVYSYRPL